MEDYYYAGGLPAVMRALGEHGMLDKDALTVTGQTMWENVKDAPNWNTDVIRELGQPAHRARRHGRAAAATWRPTAPCSSRRPRRLRLMNHRGRAVVFENIEDYKAKINDEALDVDETCVLVLKNCGPKGYPGMSEVGNMGLPPKVLRKGVRDMVRISDARMSGTAYGTVVLHVCPEAAAGGTLALVENGDMIELDVEARRLHLEVDEDELARRRAAWSAPEPAMKSGYQKLYIDHVLQASEGADLDFLRRLPRRRHPAREPLRQAARFIGGRDERVLRDARLLGLCDLRCLAIVVAGFMALIVIVLGLPGRLPSPASTPMPRRSTFWAGSASPRCCRGPRR